MTIMFLLSLNVFAENRLSFPEARLSVRRQLTFYLRTRYRVKRVAVDDRMVYEPTARERKGWLQFDDGLCWSEILDLTLRLNRLSVAENGMD